MGVAMQWVARIFGAAVMMILPGLAGLWLDQSVRVEFHRIGWIRVRIDRRHDLPHLRDPRGGCRAAASNWTALKSGPSGKQDTPHRE